MLRAELLKILERLAVSESDVVGQVVSAQMEVADSAHASGRIAIVVFAHEKSATTLGKRSHFFILLRAMARLISIRNRLRHRIRTA